MPMETEYLTASEATGLIWTIKNPIAKHSQRRRAEVTAHLLQPKRYDSILDVGCGDGYQLSYIVRRTHRITGIDISLKKLKVAREKVKGVDYICASSENLPFKREIFSKVMCLELLEHLPNPNKTLKEIQRVLKNVGTLIVSVPYKGNITFTLNTRGELTALYGHLHSFDEQRLASVLPNDFAILHQVYICNIIASYPLFAFLPMRLWKLLDSLTGKLPKMKPTWFISKIKKRMFLQQTNQCQA